MLPGLYPSSRLYTPQQFTDLLINLYKQHILVTRHFSLVNSILISYQRKIIDFGPERWFGVVDIGPKDEFRPERFLILNLGRGR